MSLPQTLGLLQLAPEENFAVAAILDGRIRPQVTPVNQLDWVDLPDGWNHYITGNPIKPGVTGRPRAADVVEQRWTLVDCDPEKTKDDPQGLDPERRALAAGVARSVWELTGGVLVNSGRGHQVWVRVSGVDCSRLLRSLRARFECDGVKIDGTHDASRLMRLPGSVNQRTGETVKVLESDTRVVTDYLGLPEPPARSKRLVSGADFGAPDLSLLKGLPKKIWDTEPGEGKRSERDARFVLECLRAGLPQDSVCRLLFAMPHSKALEDKRGERYWEATVRWANSKLDEDEQRQALLLGLGSAELETVFDDQTLEALAWAQKNDPVLWARTRGALKKNKQVQIKAVEEAIKATAAQKDVERARGKVRHAKKEGEALGWLLDVRGEWVSMPKGDICSWLLGAGIETGPVLTQAINDSYELVGIPFADEYPSEFEWNRFGAAFAFDPEPGEHPTWDQVLRVVGRGLDWAVKEDSWCQANGITTGGQYLLHWVAGVFQHPEDPSAYLFFVGPEQTGKSTFHEALKRLLKRGWCLAKQALVSEGGFNGELDGAVLAVIDDFKIPPRSGSKAHNRLKEWVTGEWISIHNKGMKPYEGRSYLHFIHCANGRDHCPVFDRDTRITVIEVTAPDEADKIDKNELKRRLTAEGPAFLHTALSLELPAMTNRYRVPPVETGIKADMQIENMTELQRWAHTTPGWLGMEDQELCEAFTATLYRGRAVYWPPDRILRELPREEAKLRKLVLRVPTENGVPASALVCEDYPDARRVGQALRQVRDLVVLDETARPKTWRRATEK